jgi:hypothetical protein
MSLFPGCNRGNGRREIPADLSAKAKKSHVAPEGGRYHFGGMWLVAQRAIRYKFGDVTGTKVSEFQGVFAELRLQKLLHITGSIQNGVFGESTRRSQVVLESGNLLTYGCWGWRDGNRDPSSLSESIKKELQGCATFFHLTIAGRHAATVSEVFVEKQVDGTFGNCGWTQSLLFQPASKVDDCPNVKVNGFRGVSPLSKIGCELVHTAAKRVAPKVS